MTSTVYIVMLPQQGRIQGGAHPARAPLKLEKKYDFLA